MAHAPDQSGYIPMVEDQEEEEEEEADEEVPGTPPRTTQVSTLNM